MSYKTPTAYAVPSPAGSVSPLAMHYPDGVPDLGIAPGSELLVPLSAGFTVTARNLQAGMVIIRSGRTPRIHDAITVTAAAPVGSFGRTAVIRVDGFTLSDQTPRVMFRSLAHDLPMLVLNPATVAAGVTR